MRNSKLIKVIEKFTKPEIKRLWAFVSSPYFNSDKKVQALFDFIYKYAPYNFEHKKFTAQNAFQFVYTDKGYDNSVLIKLQSRLLKVVELFIYYDIEAKHLPAVEISLMRFYNRNKLTSHFKNAYVQVQKKQDDFIYRNADYYYRQFLIEHEYDLFKSIKLENSTGEMNHSQRSKMLDIFYLSKKLNVLCLMYNRERISNIEYPMFFKDEILAILPKSDYAKLPVIALLHQALLLLKDVENSEHYFRLKNLLSENGKLLNKMEQRTLYTYLENTARNIFENRNEYYNELFKLYDAQLQNEVLYIEGFLLPAVFKNIVVVALKLNQVDWVADFLDKNQHKIPPEYEDSEDVHSYCLAQLCFKQNKFDDVLELLNKMAFNDIYTKMDIRRLYLRVYYERKNDITFEGMVNSFRKFLNKNQFNISPVHIEANRSFINISNKIYNVLKKDQEKLNIIEKQIDHTKVLPAKEWLQEKLRELR